MLEGAAEGLVKLGLKEYEARVYASLVALGEGTVRQVHDASKVPRPRIYDVVESLSDKGLVEIRQGTPLCFRATEPSKVVAKLRSDFEVASGDVITRLEKMSVEGTRRTSPVWYATGEWSVSTRMHDLIDSARQDIFLLCNRPASMKAITSKIAQLSKKLDINCILVSNAAHFKGHLGDAKLYEPNDTDDEFIKALEFLRIFKGKVRTENNQYRVEFMIAVDGRESILTYEVNGKRMCIMSELPITTLIQREILRRIITTSTKIV